MTITRAQSPSSVRRRSTYACSSSRTALSRGGCSYSSRVRWQIWPARAAVSRATVALPALEVLRRRDEGPVEAGTEPLHRVRRPEEVAAVSDLLMGPEGERLPRRSRGALNSTLHHLQQLDVDDELLVAADEAAFEPAGRVHDEVRPGEEGRHQRHERFVARLGVGYLARGRAPRRSGTAGRSGGRSAPCRAARWPTPGCRSRGSPTACRCWTGTSRR